jgi:hypothetical protein
MKVRVIFASSVLFVSSSISPNAQVPHFFVQIRDLETTK